MDPCVPLPMVEKQLHDLVEKAKDFCLMHGICLRRKEAFDRDALHFAPFLLLPSPFPKQEFERCLDVQTLLQELIHKVATDRKFLTDTLTTTIQVDEFTKRLFKIYDIVHNEGLGQPLSLGLLRSDLMLEGMSCKSAPFCCWKQVEVNTIASGFGWMGPASTLLHRYILGEMRRQDLVKNIPENRALEGLAEGMLAAWSIYVENYQRPSAVILFVVEDLTYNICDQRFHEFEIRKQNPDCYVIRATLTEIAQTGRLSPDNKALLMGEYEVAVVYFRCGYSPEQYPTEAEWDARLMIERSRAIKSPSIQYHLAGTKKVQQQLAVGGIVEKYFDDQAKVDKIKKMFTGLYSIDSETEEGKKAFQMAMEDPEKFVLKPQREGGGNNVYGSDIVPFLKKIEHSLERNAYILMDRISPPVTANYMVRPASPPKLIKCLSELGVFGYIIGDNEGKIVVNKQVGHTLRTKLSHVNEGGVSAGLGALDSVLLVDVERCCESCEETSCCGP